jgi:trigger factor
MKVTLNKTENRTSYLTVETETSDMEEYLDKVYRRIVKRMEVPGVPRGSASRDIIEKHVGRDKMIEDAIQEMIPEICSKVVKEQKLDTQMQPLIKTIQKDPFIFEIIAPLRPLVKLGDYRNMRVEPESLEIKKEEVDLVLSKLRVQFAKYNIADRPVREGDLLTIDIEGIVSGSPFMQKNDVQFRVTPDFAPDIPDLYKQMLGMKKGEQKEFKLNLSKRYTGKATDVEEASFKVKVYDIKEMILPELNDEFANRVAPGIKTLDLLKERIAGNMRIEREQNAEQRFENKLMDSLIKISRFEYPPVKIEIEAQGLINDYKEQLKASCHDNQEYEEKMRQISDADLKERAVPLARKRILWALVINEAAKAENIEIDDAEVAEEIERMIGNAAEEEREEQREYFNYDQNRQDVYELIKARKTIKRLVEIVKVSNKL